MIIRTVIEDRVGTGNCVCVASAFMQLRISRAVNAFHDETNLQLERLM
jgi:hypothetical protein